MEAISTSNADRLKRRSRTLAWIALALGCLSLAMTIVARAFESAPHWWALAIPLLLISNVSVMGLRVLRRWPRLERCFIGVSLTLAVLVLIAEIRIWL